MVEKVSAFIFRGFALVCQFATVLLLVDLLKAEQFGRYAAAISAGTIIVSIMDFGFTRYSFRLINRGFPSHLVYGRILEFRILSLPVFGTLIAFGSPMIGVSRWEVLYAIITALAIQLLSFSRYKLIRLSKVSRAILIESVTPIGFCLLLGVIKFWGVKFDSLSAIRLNCLVAVMAVLSCIKLTRENGDWGLALKSIVRRPFNFGSLGRTFHRSLPVGLEQSTLALWYGVPVLASSLMAPIVRPEAALFQRIFTVITSILSVFIAIDLRTLYDRGRETRLVAEVVLLMIAGFVAGVAACMILDRFLSMWAPVVYPGGMVGLAKILLSHRIILCLSLAVLVPYTKASWLLLGRNLRWERMCATAVGLLITVSTISLGALIYSLDEFAIQIIMLSMFIGQVAGLVIMLLLRSSKLSPR